jgi:hypothetical protein
MILRDGITVLQTHNFPLIRMQFRNLQNIARRNSTFNHENNTTLTLDKSPPQKYADKSKKQNRTCNT